MHIISFSTNWRPNVKQASSLCKHPSRLFPRDSRCRYVSRIVIMAGMALLLALGLSSCGKPASESRSASRKSSDCELLLYCGAGIRPAAKDLIAAFETENPDITINTTYGGGGRLFGQISSSKKGDLFMPGAQFYVDTAIDSGLAVGESKQIVAYFVPVLFVQKDNPEKIRNLADLKKEKLRVGLGDERACAVGKKSLAIFEKNGISYSEIEDNVVYKSGTVNELGVAIQLGNVDAVIIWDANARRFSEHGDIVEIPIEQNIPSKIPLVALNSSQHLESACAFIDFVVSNTGQNILKKNDYTVSLKN